MYTTVNFCLYIFIRVSVTILSTQETVQFSENLHDVKQTSHKQLALSYQVPVALICHLSHLVLLICLKIKGIYKHFMK